MSEMSEKMKLFVREMGNHRLALGLWSIVGVVSSYCAPILWLGGDVFWLGGDVKWGILGVCVSLILYGLGYWLIRPHHLMRRRERGWVENVGGNSGVTIMTVILIFARHEELSATEVWSQVFLASVAFGLMEILRPSFDFGLLQFFLRLPLQCAFVLKFVKREDCLGLLIFTVVMYLGCSAWGFYYLPIFGEGQRAGTDGVGLPRTMADAALADATDPDDASPLLTRRVRDEAERPS